MASSVCARAQSSSTLSTSLESTAVAYGAVSIAAVVESSDPCERSAAEFALYAGDEADNLHDVQRAYAGLERLISPVRVSDEADEEIHATRSELGALVRVVNEELRRRIEAVHAAIGSVREALNQGGET